MAFDAHGEVVLYLRITGFKASAGQNPADCPAEALNPGFCICVEKFAGSIPSAWVG